MSIVIESTPTGSGLLIGRRSAVPSAMAATLRHLFGLILLLVVTLLIGQHLAVHRGAGDWPAAQASQSAAFVVADNPANDAGPGCSAQLGGAGCASTPTNDAAEDDTLALDTAASTAKDATKIACPTYSGPLFRKDSAMFGDVAASKAASRSPYEGNPTPPLGWLQALPLEQVRLLSGSRQWRSFQV